MLLKIRCQISTSRDKDHLQYISSQFFVRVNVDYVVYNLIGEISSDHQANDGDNSLEQYLVSDYQGMARTKNTGQKTSPKKNPFISTGGGPTVNAARGILSGSISTCQ